jgi:hypothetical protein
MFDENIYSASNKLMLFKRYYMSLLKTSISFWTKLECLIKISNLLQKLKTLKK